MRSASHGSVYREWKRLPGMQRIIKQMARIELEVVFTQQFSTISKLIIPSQSDTLSQCLWMKYLSVKNQSFKKRLLLPAHLI